MAGQSFVQLATDGTGKKMDTSITTTAAQHRQVMAIGDSVTDANVASVSAAGALKVDNSAVTQPISGTITAVTAITNALPSGTNLLGKVGIDQTTPGTTNGIQQNAMTLTTATLQSAVSATGNGSTLTVSGYDTIVFNITGTFVATVNFEVSPDSGTTWVALPVVTVGTSTIGTSATTTGVYRGSVSGMTTVRGRVTWTSGTSVTVTANVVPDATHSFSNNANLFLGGTAADGNSGNKSAQTQRVVLATDQPTMTNAQPVTLQTQTDTIMVGGVNIKEINAVTPLMGNGVTGTGSQRVTIASDNTANSNPWLVSGAAAAGASASGNVLRTGALGRTTLPTAVSSAQMVDILADRFGRLYTISPVLTTTSSAGTPITTNTNTSIVTAPSAGNHLRVYRLQAQNSSATGTWCYWGNGSGVKTIPFYLAQYQVYSVDLKGEWELSSATALFMNTATTGANIEWFVTTETLTD